MISNSSVTVLNVGHGNAAVIRDGGYTIVVDTGGSRTGGKLLRYLRDEGIYLIDCLILSHSDEDHIGNAATLLLASDVQISKVFLNVDSTKNTAAFAELKFALRTARREKKISITTALTTEQSSSIPSEDVQFEILFPPPEISVSGAGVRDLDGVIQTTNSLSAVIRLTCKGVVKVLLPGDSSGEALSFWNEEGTDLTSDVVVFPHHGGRPGKIDPGQFAHDFTGVTKPKFIIFSIHVSKHNLPREDVLTSIRATHPGTHLMCTQLPDHLEPICFDHPWTYHYENANVIKNMHVRICMTTGNVSVIKDEN